MKAKTFRRLNDFAIGSVNTLKISFSFRKSLKTDNSQLLGVVKPLLLRWQSLKVTSKKNGILQRIWYPLKTLISSV